MDENRNDLNWFEIFFQINFQMKRFGKKSDAERKRIFDVRQQRRTQRLERNGKAGDQTGADGADGADESKVDELAAIDELKDDEIELAE